MDHGDRISAAMEALREALAGFNPDRPAPLLVAAKRALDEWDTEDEPAASGRSEASPTDGDGTEAGGSGPSSPLRAGKAPPVGDRGPCAKCGELWGAGVHDWQHEFRYGTGCHDCGAEPTDENGFCRRHDPTRTS